MTHLGSRRWHDANWTHAVDLGESLDSPQIFDAGEPPAVLPLPVIRGNRDCFALGELPADAIDPDTLIDGFPPSCFEGILADDLLWNRAASIGRCAIQRFYARMIDFLYVDDAAAVVNGFRNLLGADVPVTVHPVAGYMPSVATVITPGFSIAVVDGTRNEMQLALQGFTSIRRPTNRGELSTVPLWWEASQWIHDKLAADGADPTKPVMLAGHSYGGAASLVLAARYRHNRPTRVIRALTYGCPKPGDTRLRDLVSRCQTVNLANDSDLVTTFPPDFATLLPVMTALGLPYLSVWAEWERPPYVVVLDPNGNPMVGPPPNADYATLLAIVEDVIEGQTINPISGHSITQYINRLETRCPDAEWPVSEEIIEEWPEPPPEPPHPDYVILMEDSGNVLQETDPPILVEDN